MKPTLAIFSILLCTLAELAWAADPPHVAAKPQDNKPEAAARAASSPTQASTVPTLIEKLKPRWIPVKPAHTEMHRGLISNRIVVKFRDGARFQVTDNATAKDAPRNNTKTDRPQAAEQAGARLVLDRNALTDRDKQLLSRRKLDVARVAADIDAVNRVLQAPGVAHWGPLFSKPAPDLETQRVRAELSSGVEAADLATYYSITLEEGRDGDKIAETLNALESVEIAYLAPMPEPADITPTTPNFGSQQSYLNNAPGGIQALGVWANPGGRGAGVRIIDIEDGWILDHEDLPKAFVVDGSLQTQRKYVDHGAAVLGVMVAKADSAGVTGIAADAQYGVVSSFRKRTFLAWHWDEYNLADAIFAALTSLSPGDIILIEQHAQGPLSGDFCCGGTCGYVPMEYWQAEFDAIHLASARGVVVVEAGGNGAQNLDANLYRDLFDRKVRDSGAIIVGAGCTPNSSASCGGARAAQCWSNAGTRLDLQGWGDSVVTLGYGDLAKAGCGASGPATNTCLNDDRQWYTKQFNGTSSASPIVAGTVASLQGLRKARGQAPFEPAEVRDLLVRTGTPQAGSRLIGPLPNLSAAVAAMTPAPPIYSYALHLSATATTVAGVTGYAGNATPVGQTADPYAAERLQFGERSDKGCFVKVESGHIQDKSQPRKFAQLDLCGNKGTTDRSLQYVPLLTTSHDTFIYGIGACTTKTENYKRLKGARVYRAQIDAEGKLTKLTHEDQRFDRANCDTWHTPVFCEDGEFATEVVAQFQKDDGNDEILTGLGLRCKKVEVTKTCTQNCP